MTCPTFASECKRGCTDKCAAENAYIPSNGSEGMGFMSCFCEQCIHDNPDPEKKPKCDIIALAMLYYPTDPKYPGEWIYKNNEPTCTKFVKWEWDNDGDPGDPDNPKAPVIPDPRQLNLFPLFPTEQNTQTNDKKEVLQNTAHRC
jgi:hypothetical protein